MWTLITVTMVVTPVAGVSWPQIESLRVSDANFYGKPKWSFPKIRRTNVKTYHMNKTRLWFEPCFIFTPTWGNDPIWQIRKKTLHSGRLTRNPKMEASKMMFLCNFVIFRFHVHFQGLGGVELNIPLMTHLDKKIIRRPKGGTFESCQVSVGARLHAN